MHLSTVESIAEKAWNITKDEADPEYRETPPEHRHRLISVARDVIASKTADTDFDRAVIENFEAGAVEIAPVDEGADAADPELEVRQEGLIVVPPPVVEDDIDDDAPVTDQERAVLDQAFTEAIEEHNAEMAPQAEASADPEPEAEPIENETPKADVSELLNIVAPAEEPAPAVVAAETEQSPAKPKASRKKRDKAKAGE